MNSTNDEDLENSNHEFTVPLEIVPAVRSVKATTQQAVIREFQDINASEERPVDISRFVHSFRRNWLLGILLGMIAAGPLGALAWKMLPLEYTASESIRVSPTQASLVFDSNDLQRGDFKLFKNTQKQLVLQPFSLNKAMKDSEVAKLPEVSENPDPVGWLQKQLKVEFPDESELMIVSLKSSNPKVAYHIVKAVVDVYMNDNVDKEKAERLARIDTLERVLKDTEEKVRKKRNELSNLVSSLGMSDKSTVDLSQQLTLQQFGEVRKQLAKTNFDVMALENELEFRKNLKLDAPSGAEVNKVKFEEAGPVKFGTDNKSSLVSTAEHKSPENGTGSNDPGARSKAVEEQIDPKLEELIESDVAATRLLKEVERLKNMISAAPKRYDAKTAAKYVAEYQVKLDEAKQKLDDRTKRLQLRNVEAVGGVSEAEILKAKIGVFNKQQELLKEEMATLMVESKKFGRSSIDVEMLRKEIDALEPMVSQVSQRVEKMKIEMQSASRITRLPSNGVPSVGLNKKRLPVTAFAGLVGLFGPLALLMLRDFLRNYVNSASTINDGMKISVLGTMPYVPTKVLKRLNDPKHVTAKRWRERIDESVAGVTAMLLRRLAADGHRVVMIASATSGEGKSTLSEQLARGLADSGHRTLLIDFDLRRPELHRRFNTSIGPGVSEILRSGADLKQVAQQTYSPNLNILTAGNCRGNLMSEAANGTLQALFNECRSEYEFVIVDSSPLLPVVDGRLVGQFTDGAIVSVKKDTSKVSQVLAARNIMGDFGITVLGCVVTGENNGDYYDSYGTTRDSKGAVARGITASRSTSAM